MATYHLNVRKISKAKGQSAKAKSDYINREDKYSKRFEDLRFSDSGNMPSFSQNNPEKFWEFADIYERANARVCTEIEFALPRELTLEQNRELVQSFIKSTIDNEQHKLPYSFAIHNDQDNHNPHCHLIFSERHNDGIERTAEKFFKRANGKDLALGGAKKSTYANSREFVQDIRTKWRELANYHLEKSGYAARIDERSYKNQGVEQQARPRLDRVTWQELKRLEQDDKLLDKALEDNTKKIEIAKNASKSSVARLNQKVDKSIKEVEKTPQNRNERVLQADFDVFIYKTIKNAERPKFEHERKIEEWEKEQKQLQSSYASYKNDLMRLESEKWGILGLYQSKEQKAEIERIKGIMSDLSDRFDNTKDYIAKEQEKIEQINKQNQPLYDRKAEILRNNPDLIEKSMSQLHREFFNRNREKWKKEQEIKQKSRSLSRDKGLSL